MKNIICWIHGSLEQMGLQELVNKYEGYFIVNYDDYEVIYSDGYENENGMWCYKISDLYKKPENMIVDKIKEEQENEDTTTESVDNQSTDGEQEISENTEGNTTENVVQ